MCYVFRSEMLCNIHLQAKRGKCKINKEVAFVKGDPRAVVQTGSGKFFLSLSAAREVLHPILGAASAYFDRTTLKGLDLLSEEDRAFVLSEPPASARSEAAAAAIAAARLPPQRPLAELAGKGT